MNQSLSSVDPDGRLEYSVVFSDRSLNHMSRLFQGVMRDLSSTLKEVYNAHSLAIVPGGGSCAMEAVARQFATGERCLVIRNGWFSFRWSQILEAGRLAAATTVLKAHPAGSGDQAPFAPPPIDAVVDAIARDRPAVVFAPHVETASGILLGRDYLATVARATHAAGGLFVLDCIASGALWVDMRDSGVDVLLSAPQKGWSSSACAGLVMFSEAAAQRLPQTRGSSFALDLQAWRNVMASYEQGGHSYYATLPTDALRGLRDNVLETRALGWQHTRERQQRLGDAVRELLAARGYASVAAHGCEAPSVVVSYTADEAMHDGSAFAAHNVQIAAGVPLACDEPPGFKSFRVGLFGLDKLRDVDGTLARFAAALDAVEGRGRA